MPKECFMKKEARTQAEKLFVKSKGKITNRDIAKEVGVNALTVGRWKRENDWDGKLKAAEPAPAKAPKALKAAKAAKVVKEGTVRKKEALDKAEKIYMDSRGTITNKDLADKVGVSPATVSKWKEQHQWTENLKTVEVEVGPEIAPEGDLDVGDLTSPEHIIQINQKIDNLLQRDYLTAAELADLAQAKGDLLQAVEIYLAIVREMGEMYVGD
jgi:transposase